MSKKVKSGNASTKRSTEKRQENSTRALTPGKRYKGSALLTEGGEFLFSPYAEEGAGESPWRVLASNKYAVLRCTREVVQLRLTVRKDISNDPFRTMRKHAFDVLMRNPRILED